LSTRLPTDAVEPWAQEAWDHHDGPLNELLVDGLLEMCRLRLLVLEAGSERPPELAGEAAATPAERAQLTGVVESRGDERRPRLSEARLRLLTAEHEAHGNDQPRRVLREMGRLRNLIALGTRILEAGGASLSFELGQEAARIRSEG
jgi:hypothetical protein